ncbi:uncharacterized protein FIBRA_05493 [Fibroporia radiculosa]|uniref:RRM domain-containing protein n=1 Tax=Fibroporia radiculosa TaxID=599839 RepID=J4H3J3_9APHY|nr:uncharacterized protein FIBRA_05493 [Fibroporia radiculosa]CCM03364.1 predicted protein [Fibroporia radiculosa]
MSRPDGLPHDFDLSLFDGRGISDHTAHGSSRDFGPSMRELTSFRDNRLPDSLRDPSSRLLPANYYVSSPPPPFSADRRPLTSTAQNVSGSGAGYSSFVAPRMHNASQDIGVGGAGDSWTSKPATLSATNVNKHTSEGGGVASHVQVQQSLSPFVHNHNHHTPPPPRGPPVQEHYTSPLLSSTPDTRDLYLTRHIQHQPHHQPSSSHAQSQSPTNSSRSTLWWGELEPWMDEEYAKQVCNLMGWDPVNIKVPRPPPDTVTGQQANNPGYCFLTFPSQAHAASVLSQINSSSNSPAMIMPNSSKPFSLNWTSSIPSPPVASALPGQTATLQTGQNPQYPKEYSIFVGDLAPEVSNSDLVAVFRNPVLGLRNDREPRFIRPFLSCKSAKIMLDPVTGVSRGYGFVRFTDETDQQRALIEMHGLYCLSRPMRISPATAKFKPAPGMTSLELAQMSFPLVPPPAAVMPDQQGQVTIALPVPSNNQTKSVSAPLAGSASSTSNGHTVSNSTSNSSLSAPSLSSGSSTTSSATLASTSSDDALKVAAQYGNGGSSGSSSSTNGGAPSVSAPFAQTTHDQAMAQKYNISEESWKHHAQARAILSNLIGPNGEQLTSSDPYNTTVFVGGLSPLISEETLRTFFAPFGDIHYVKVPVGKHCGFVQFVRKPDAERAIEKMQGFPIGGSRIRLSWGRSQYKAAQAAAQAAQAAAFQAQYQTQATVQNSPALTPDQALQLLEKFGLTHVLSNGTVGQPPPPPVIDTSAIASAVYVQAPRSAIAAAFKPPIFGLSQQSSNTASSSTFSPFSPDPNYLGDGAKNQELNSVQPQPFVNPSKGFSSWYTSMQDDKAAQSGGKASPTTLPNIRPPSASQRFNSLLGETTSTTSPFQQSRASSRQETHISRPDISRTGSHGQDQYIGQEHEHDIIQDLNGTLASLDLNNSPGMWKGGESAHTLPSSP